MKTKIKLCLGALASVATVGAVMPLATACSKASDVITHVHESADDFRYGLNANTYKQLKKDYESKLTNSMISQGIQKGSSLWNSKMSNMQLAFNEFDNQANTISMSYATLTSSLMKYAATVDNIQLRRVTNTKWSDINAMFRGAYDSLELYMTHEHFSEARKTQILNDAVTKFNLKITQLENEGYKENDPFGALQEARRDLIHYFDEINDRVAYISTYIRLNDFYSKYVIRYRTLEDSSAYKNVWSEITKYVSKQIPTDLFNRLFYVVDVETGNKIKFEPTLLVPGYTFIPKLVSCSADEKRNVFKVDIDMGLIKSSFLNTNDEERIKKLTVHSVDVDEGYGIVDKTGELEQALIENKDVSNDSDFFEMTSKLPIKTNSYNLWNQIKQENLTIKDTYFNKEKDKYIRFRWPESTSENAKIDPFINKISFDDESKTSYVSIMELGEAGLEMSEDGKNWYTIPEVMFSSLNKTGLNTLNAFNSFKHDYTLMEDFVQNCVILSEVKYVEKQSGSYEITNKFYITFKNSENPMVLNDIYLLEDEFITGKCENYKISQYEFVRVSTIFSKTKNLVEEYTEKSQAVNKIHKSVCGWMAFFSTAIAIMGSCVIALSARMYATTTKANDIAGIIAGVAGIAFSSWSIDILRKMKSRTSDYLDRLDHVKNDNSVITLRNKIDEFSKIFVDVDEHGNYDKEQAKIKGAKFSSLKFKEQWELVTYFNSIFEPNHDGYNFKQLIEKNNVGEPAVNELKDMFSVRNSDFVALITNSVEVSAYMLAVVHALAYSIRDKQKVEAAKKARNGPAISEKDQYDPEFEKLAQGDGGRASDISIPENEEIQNRKLISEKTIDALDDSDCDPSIVLRDDLTPEGPIDDVQKASEAYYELETKERTAFSDIDKQIWPKIKGRASDPTHFTAAARDELIQTLNAFDDVFGTPPLASYPSDPKLLPEWTKNATRLLNSKADADRLLIRSESLYTQFLHWATPREDGLKKACATILLDEYKKTWNLNALALAEELGIDTNTEKFTKVLFLIIKRK